MSQLHESGPIDAYGKKDTYLMGIFLHSKQAFPYFADVFLSRYFFLSSSDINKLLRQSSIFKRMPPSLLNTAESILIECYLSPGLHTEQPELMITRLQWVSI